MRSELLEGQAILCKATSKVDEVMVLIYEDRMDREAMHAIARSFLFYQ